MQYIVDADVEDLVRIWLSDRLTALGWTVWTGTKLPNPLPAESVLVFTTGGAQGTIRTARPLVTVESRAVRETRAREIAATVDGLLRAAGRDGVVWDGHQLYSVAGGKPASLPDPVNKMPRYTATYELHIAGDVREL